MTKSIIRTRNWAENSVCSTEEYCDERTQSLLNKLAICNSVTDEIDKKSPETRNLAINRFVERATQGNFK